MCRCVCVCLCKCLRTCDTSLCICLAQNKLHSLTFKGDNCSTYYRVTVKTLYSILYPNDNAAIASSN